MLKEMRRKNMKEIKWKKKKNKKKNKIKKKKKNYCINIIKIIYKQNKQTITLINHLNKEIIIFIMVFTTRNWKFNIDFLFLSIILNEKEIFRIFYYFLFLLSANINVYLIIIILQKINKSKHK